MPNRHLSNVLWVLASQFFVLASTGLLMLGLTHWLSTENFGYYQVILSVIALGSILTDLGLSHSLARYLAEYRRNAASRVRTALVSGFFLKTTVVVTACLAIYLFRGRLAAILELERIENLLGLAVLILAGFSFHNFLLKVFEGLQDFKMIPLVNVIKNSLDVILSLALVILGFQLTGALWGRFLSLAVAVGVGAYLVLGRRGPDISGKISGLRATGARIAGYGTALTAVDLTSRVLENADKLLINVLAGPAMVAVYAVPARTVEIAQMLGMSVATAVAPSQIPRTDSEGGSGSFLESLRLLLIFYVLAAVLLIQFSSAFIQLLFSEEYGGSARVLKIIGLALPFMGISPLVSLSLNYLGEARRRIVFSSSAAALSILGNVLLIPRLGVTGAAVTLLVSQIYYCTSQLLYGLTVMRQSRSRVLGAAARLAIAGLLAYLAMSGIRQVLPPIWGAVLAATGGIVVYAFLVLRTGVLSGDEIQRLLGRVRS